VYSTCSTRTRRQEINKTVLPFFTWGFFSALVCGLVARIFFLFILAVPGVIAGSLIFFTGNKSLKKYGFFIFSLAVLSVGYSYFYDFFSGSYFSIWESIHICGPCGLAGYGVLLLLTRKEYTKILRDTSLIDKGMKITAAAGIILFLFGIWWGIIIVSYYGRFFYWPLFWTITGLCCGFCLGIGVFAFLLVQQRKKILPLFESGEDNALFPLFRSVLTEKIPGILFISLALLCMVYQTQLFPLTGF
jgi:hypothetical protein